MCVESAITVFCLLSQVAQYVTVPLLADCTLLRWNIFPRNSKVELRRKFKKLVLIISDNDDKELTFGVCCPKSLDIRDRE
jgi:hypothetical protein